MKFETLHVQRPFGKTLLIVCVLLVLGVVAGELVTGTTWLQSKLSRPTWGSRHSHFERQLDRLNHITSQVGPVDCIFLGSSMVINDFDPLTFVDAFRQNSGQELHCFNFGVDGLTALGAAALAKILVMDYRPRLLVYGTDARDYVVPPQADDVTVLLGAPWIEYRLGGFSLMGWLFENSSLLRYRRPLSAILQLDFARAFWSQDSPTESSQYGFIPDERLNELVSKLPDPNSDSRHVQYYYGLFSDYQMLPENLSALDEIANLANNTTRVIILEMPVPYTYFGFFGNGEQDHRTFLNGVERVARENNVPFLTTTSKQLIPNSGWVDYSHLNAEGARIFSQWLGEHFAKAIVSGKLTLPEVRPRMPSELSEE